MKALWLGILLVCAGCGTLSIKTMDPITVDLTRGPPGVVSVKVGGVEKCRVEHPTKALSVLEVSK